MPELVLVLVALLLHGARLLQRRRTEDVHLHAGQHLLETRLAAVVRVDVLAAHVHQRLDRVEIREVVVAQKRNLFLYRLRRAKGGDLLKRKPRDVVHGGERADEPFRALERGGWRGGARLRLRMLGPGLQDDIGIEIGDQLPGLPAEPRDVIAMAMGGDDGGQLAARSSP